MIDLQKSVIEAEALAKLRKEQYYRELLAGELGVMIDAYFASKEPLREVIPQFVVAIKDLAITAREIFDYIEGVKSPEYTAPFEEPVKAAEEDDIDAVIPDKVVTTVGTVTLEETKATQEAPSTAAEPEAPKAAEPKKRIPSKDIISDEELDRHYFKEGLSIPVIASMFKVGASGLYKRIEQMKADRKKIEKECAR